ncbi:MAG: hypothetical protein OXQ29_03530 [Rhodospirillaceae bacterium]|nr:hypothetical protein [Rhodospirillaceae bacterium]
MITGKHKRVLADAQARITVLETENRNYTETITNALLEAATDAVTDGYVAALEIAAGQLARAFASATLSGSGATLFPVEVMSQIGRSLVEAGEAIWVIRGDRLIRADNYGLQPNGYYQIQFNTEEAVLPPSRVFHARWSVDLASGRGVAPLTRARTLKTLMQRLEGSLSDESDAPVGYLLPLPTDGADTNIDKLKEQLASLKGRIAVVETMRGGWGEGPAAAPRQEYQLARMGPAYPDSSIQLFESARNTVLAACGYPVQLVMQQDGTGQREAWRRYLHGTVAPLGRLVARAAAQVNRAVQVDFDELFASDIQGRARAFQSLVGGGMDITAAAAASGILSMEEP